MSNTTITVASVEDKKAGDEISVAISINTASPESISALDLIFRFDENQLEPLETAVSAGALTQSWGAPVANVVNGIVTISQASASPLSAKSGEILILNFKIKEGATGEILIGLDETQSLIMEGDVEFTATDGAIILGSSGNNTAPVFSTAATTTDGSKIILSYDKVLSAETASVSDFTVEVDGSVASITGVATSGSTIELTLASPVKNDQTVSVAYIDPSARNDSSAVQDTEGNDAASLSSTSVSNNSTVDGSSLDTTITVASVEDKKAGDEISVAISINTASPQSISALDLIFRFDENQLEPLETAVSAGALTQSWGAPVANVVNGMVTVSQASALSLSAKSGEILILNFKIKEGATGEISIDLDETQSLIMEGDVEFTATDGAIILGSSGNITAPVFSTAATTSDGSKIILSYDKVLSAETASVSDFTVEVDGSVASITGVATSGSTIELTLASPVKNDQTVSVAYIDPSASNDSSAVQDTEGNDAASLSSTSVSNNSTVDGSSLDTSPPSILSAEIDGDSLTITMNEAIKETVPKANYFKVMKGRKKIKVEDVSVDTEADSVTLTLKDAVVPDDVVSLDYKTMKKDQDKDVIEDLAGNDLQSIKGLAVVNNTFVDPNLDITSPSIASAVIDGDSLIITMNEAIKETIPKANNFKVMKGRKKIKVEDVSVDSDAASVTLTLKDAVVPDDVVSFDYKTKKKDQDKDVIEDLAGNDLQSIKGVAVVNNTFVDPNLDITSPSIASAVIDGVSLTITLNEDIKETIPKASNFKVMTGRKKIKVEDVSVDTEVDSVTLTLKDAVVPDDVVSFDYKTKKKDQDKDVIEDLAGNDLQSIKGVEVVNNTFVDPNLDITPPSITAAVIDGNILTIDLDEALSPTLPKFNNFKVKIDRKTSKVEAVDVSTGTDPSQLFIAGLTDAEGVQLTAPNHNSITSESEFRSLVNVYAGSISQSAVFQTVSAFDNTFDHGIQATVGAESFTWNVSNHGADAVAGTGPHATRDGVGLSFTDAELSAILKTTGTVRLTLKTAAEASDVVTLDYKTKKKDQSKDVIEDLVGNDLQSIKGIDVTNITSRADPITGFLNFWEFEDSSYALVKNALTHAAAATAAVQAGGYLVEVNSAFENQELFARISDLIRPDEYEQTTASDGGGSAYVWLGGSDQLVENDWVWLHSGESISRDLGLWGSGSLGSEPDDFDDQDAVAIGLENWPFGSADGQGFGNAGSWNDVDISNELFYVIEF